VKKTPGDRILMILFAMGIVSAFAAGSYIAQKWVSPCVCVYATQARIN